MAVLLNLFLAGLVRMPILVLEHNLYYASTCLKQAILVFPLAACLRQVGLAVYFVGYIFEAHFGCHDIPSDVG